MPGTDGTVLIEDARLLFKNFAGEEGMYNRKGDRNFSVLLDDAPAHAMAEDGWNVKELRAREEGDTPEKYVQVSVKYEGRDGNKVRPPTIVMISSKGRTPISEDECEILDWVDIAKVDLIIRPYAWNVSGKSGVKAYLKSLYVTIAEDELARKYQDVPEIGAAPAQLAISSGEDEIWDAEVVQEDTKAIER